MHGINYHDRYDNMSHFKLVYKFNFSLLKTIM